VLGWRFAVQSHRVDLPARHRPSATIHDLHDDPYMLPFRMRGLRAFSGRRALSSRETWLLAAGTGGRGCMRGAGRMRPALEENREGEEQGNRQQREKQQLTGSGEGYLGSHANTLLSLPMP